MDNDDLYAIGIALVACVVVVLLALAAIMAPIYYSENKTLDQIATHTGCKTEFNFIGESWVLCDSTTVTLKAWLANQGHDYNLKLNGGAKND